MAAFADGEKIQTANYFKRVKKAAIMPEASVKVHFELPTDQDKQEGWSTHWVIIIWTVQEDYDWKPVSFWDESNFKSVQSARVSRHVYNLCDTFSAEWWSDQVLSATVQDRH